MATSCPWCLEPLPRSGEPLVHCPRCTKPLIDDDGRELRSVDLRFLLLKDAQEAQFSRFLSLGTVVAAAVGLVVPLAHFGAAVLIPLMIVGHLLAVRFFLIRDARRYVGPARRFFSRWITRLSFLWIGSIGYGLAVIPVAGAAMAAATFAGLTWLVHNYVLWSLEREASRMPLARWEKAVLVLLAVATVAMLVVVVVMTVVVGWSVTYLLEYAGL
ncbi:MAG: hypothetical protein ABFS37_03520 [Acidobacteriota bacterium]